MILDLSRIRQEKHLARKRDLNAMLFIASAPTITGRNCHRRRLCPLAMAAAESRPGELCRRFLDSQWEQSVLDSDRTT